MRRRLAGEWWTYEVCLGEVVRQFHQVEEVATALASSEAAVAALATAREEGFVLGRFRERADAEDAEDQQQLYDDGDPCDVTGTPRRSRVLFECVSPARHALATERASIVSVRESATCEYEIVVQLEKLCALEIDDAAANAQDERHWRHIDCEPTTADS